MWLAGINYTTLENTLACHAVRLAIGFAWNVRKLVMLNSQVIEDLLKMIKLLNDRLDNQSRALKSLIDISQEICHDIELLKKGTQQCQ